MWQVRRAQQRQSEQAEGAAGRRGAWADRNGGHPRKVRARGCGDCAFCIRVLLSAFLTWQADPYEFDKATPDEAVNDRLRRAEVRT